MTTDLERQLDELRRTNPQAYEQAKRGLDNIEYEMGVRPNRPRPNRGNRHGNNNKSKSYLAHKTNLILEKQKQVKDIKAQHKKDMLTEFVDLKINEKKQILSNRKKAYIKAKSQLSATTIDHKRLLDEAELALKELPLQYRMAKELHSSTEKAIKEVETLIKSLKGDVPSSVSNKLSELQKESNNYRARKLEIAIEIKKSIAIKAKLNSKWKKLLGLTIATLKSVMTLGMAGSYADENMKTIIEIMSVKGE